MAGITKRSSPRNALPSARGAIGLRGRGRLCKTCWAARATPQIGWYVGYIEKPGATWIFAMNIDMLGRRA